MKLFSYMKPYKWTVLLVVVLLVGQAYCDLALPQYTASIVDVGIGQGGIERAVPERLSGESMGMLTAQMTEEDRALVEGAYEKAADGSYALTRVTNETKDALEAAFTPVMAAVISQWAAAAQALQGQGVDTESLDPEALRRMMEDAQAAGLPWTEEGTSQVAPEETMPAGGEAEPQLEGANAELMGQQMAIAYIKAEYEALGMDLSAIQTRYLLRTGGEMLLVTLGMVAAAVFVGLFSAQISGKIGMGLREKIFGKVMSFSNGDVERFSIASLITRSTNDVRQVQMVTNMLLRMVIYAPIVGIGGVLKVVNARTGLGWIVVVAVAALLLLVITLILLAMPRFKKMPTLVDRVNLVAREILKGLQVIRAFGRERHEEDRFEDANEALRKNQLFVGRMMSFAMPVMMLIMNVVSLLIVWFGAHGIDAGTLLAGNMIAFISYTMQIVMAFLMLSMLMIMLPEAMVSAGRIDEVLRVEPSIEDGPDAAQYEGRAFRGEVVFEDVSFRYSDAEQDVLEHITFTARPGQTFAIIGGTGSGKSTILNLIPRFYDVTEGRITLDGVDIRALSQHKLRSALGYVPQKGVLFSGDIASNIKYGGDQITDAQMEKAAEIAQALPFIEEKPERFSDPIAQGGTNVSGGQKQRLSIARAIAKAPSVLLFDDSFSALDYRTDVALRRALRENVRDATVIIVAQRINTILHADQILVMEEGRAMGLGTHAELMESCEAYQEIARSQLSEAELKGGARA